MTCEAWWPAQVTLMVPPHLGRAPGGSRSQVGTNGHVLPWGSLYNRFAPRWFLLPHDPGCSSSAEETAALPQQSWWQQTLAFRRWFLGRPPTTRPASPHQPQEGSSASCANSTYLQPKTHIPQVHKAFKGQKCWASPGQHHLPPPHRTTLYKELCKYI